MDPTLRLWGQNIRERRRALGLNQRDLAEAIGVRQASVWRWERGQAEPRRHHKAALAQALRIDTRLLFPLPELSQ